MEIYVLCGCDYDETHLIKAFTSRDAAEWEASRLASRPMLQREYLDYEVRGLELERQALVES